MVAYTDPDEIGLPELRTPYQTALKKRWRYEYEQEFRLICHLPSNSVPSGSDFQVGPMPKQRGVWVSCSLPEAIMEIVLAPLSPAFLEDAVKSISRKFGLDPSVVKRSRIEEGAPTPPGAYSFSDLSKALTPCP